MIHLKGKAGADRDGMRNDEAEALVRNVVDHGRSGRKIWEDRYLKAFAYVSMAMDGATFGQFPAVIWLNHTNLREAVVPLM
jgi:hypothetical protein